jgi:multidrug efflux pump subunit AcrA (membrane-fusion protein)
VNASLTGTGYRAPADRVNGFRPGKAPGPPRPGSGRAVRRITLLQRSSAVLITGACVAAAAWYVPRIVAADARSLTGTVTSNGVVYLNFGSAGRVATVAVRVGQAVRKGQLLAAEDAPAPPAVVTADRAAIAAARAELAAVRALGVPARTAAARARLLADEAQLAIDHAKASAAQIVAPAPGTVVAVNGQPGESADAAGIHDYSSAAQAVPVTQQPLFSLLPEGPQSSVRISGSASAWALPIVALRTSSTWQVTVMVPESMVATVKPGQPVIISVPAAQISALPGRVQEVLNAPVVSGQGISYQAVVTVPGQHGAAPPDGMAADVQLRS